MDLAGWNEDSRGISKTHPGARESWIFIQISNIQMPSKNSKWGFWYKILGNNLYPLGEKKQGSGLLGRLTKVKVYNAIKSIIYRVLIKVLNIEHHIQSK